MAPIEQLAATAAIESFVYELRGDPQ